MDYTTAAYVSQLRNRQLTTPALENDKHLTLEEAANEPRIMFLGHKQNLIPQKKCFITFLCAIVHADT